MPVTLETLTWLMENLPEPVINLGSRLFGLDWKELTFIAVMAITATSRWMRISYSVGCWTYTRVKNKIEDYHISRLAWRYDQEQKRVSELADVVRAVLAEELGGPMKIPFKSADKKSA